jgi:hypothetical protein
VAKWINPGTGMVLLKRAGGKAVVDCSNSQEPLRTIERLEDWALELRIGIRQQNVTISLFIMDGLKETYTNVKNIFIYWYILVHKIYF